MAIRGAEFQGELGGVLSVRWTGDEFLPVALAAGDATNEVYLSAKRARKLAKVLWRIAEQAEK